MTMPDHEREDLVLAAAEGRLDDAQRQRLDRLRAGDPTVEEEVAELRAVLQSLQELDGWDEPALEQVPSVTVLRQAEEQIAAESGDRRAAAGHAHGHGGSAPRRRALLGIAAAGLVATGAVGSDLVRRLRPEEREGAPGTLGALERVQGVEQASGTEVRIGLIAHTWGTETVLEVAGTEPGVAYDVVLVDRAGGRTGSGSFLGTVEALDCEMNAAILREDVAEVLLLTQDGQTWARAQLPAVQT